MHPVVEAHVSGVLFTRRAPGEPTRIEASWGLGLPVVGGTITPDSYEVAPDGSIASAAGDKHIRVDVDHRRGGVVTTPVAAAEQSSQTLDDDTVMAVAELGDRVASVLGGPQDIEWAAADGTVWILQARPITAAIPAPRRPGSSDSGEALIGTPGALGAVTAKARLVRGPSDFSSVGPGEIIVCAHTDPAWTPLFAIAAGIVTETGGALSHAAIVAREYGIPAVLGVHGATIRIDNGSPITVNGTAGTVTAV